MNAKKIVGGLLLLFVAASVVFVLYKEIGAKDGSSKKVDIKKDAHPSMVVVYYFHGNMRCGACRTIERLTKKAVLEGFADEVEKGTVKFVEVNVEEGGNSHYVKQYQLSTRSVVVSKLEDGKEVKWNRLDKVWQLLSDHNEFIDYVQGEVKKMKSGDS
jgi:hypothetical protein